MFARHLLKLLLVVIFIVNFLAPSLALAAAVQNNPFGGLIVNKFFCNCSANWIITVQPPKDDLPRVLSFDFGSILYQFYKMKVGEQILGTWESASQCLVITSHGCRPKVIGDRILFPRIFMVGTSGGQLDSNPPEEEQPSQCSDGRDNDGDGRTDYPNDTGCTSADDNSEADAQCSDGRDNDGDGKVDYPDDDGCTDKDDNSETLEPCSCNCSDGKSEEETRSELTAGGIEINKGPCPRENPNDQCQSTKTGTGSNGKPLYSCTDLRCLPQIAIDGLIELKGKVGASCPVIITGGTEPGHSSHAQCKPVVDLRLGNACLDNYIRENTITPAERISYGVQYVLALDVGRTRFVDEDRDGVTRHWHVIFDGARAPQNLNKCLAKQYIIANEGWHNTSYPDAGGRSVGVGHFIVPGDGVDPNATLTDDQIGDLFERDYPSYEHQAKNTAAGKGVNFESLSEGRQIVLIDMAYNMGSEGGGGLAGFNEMWTAIKAEDWERAAHEVTDTPGGYAQQTGDRAVRNEQMMREGTSNIAQRHVDAVEKAKNYDCGA